MEFVLLVITAVGVYLLIRWASDHGSYTAGRNPAVRECTDCGQIQHMYCDSLERWDHPYWVAIGEIKTPTCKCHKDTQ